MLNRRSQTEHQTGCTRWRSPATVIAIAGGSGSGKTRLARIFKRRLGARAGVLAMDDFYLDLGHLPPGQRACINFDDPRTIDWPLLTECLNAIRQGQSVLLPRYDFRTHTRQAKGRRWRPKPIVILEGLWPLWEGRLEASFDLRLFCDCSEPLRLQRRIERDTRERGRSRLSILRQFRRHVAPMHDQWVAPQRVLADFVVGPDCTAATLASLVSRVLDRVSSPDESRAAVP